MRDQILIGPASIVRMLVQIDHRFGAVCNGGARRTEKASSGKFAHRDYVSTFQSCINEEVAVWRQVRKSVLLLAILGVSVLLAASDPSYTAAERHYWAFQPRSAPAPPDFVLPSDRTWASQSHSPAIDSFILASLEAAGLKPAPPASRRTLIRRVYYDLTGLPPSPEAVEQFVRDPAPDAWAKLVDRLLDTPEYAERSAQHWLDVVRYAESDGYEYDTHRSDLWRYRDYVIRSFAQDKPYDRFLGEQLAGDEMTTGTVSPQDDELLIASSFHRLGALRKNAGNQDAAYNRNEVLVEMTNVIGSGFLGITLGCARCHDHKFDPIRQKDYYRMQAFFATTKQKDIPMYKPEDDARWKQKKSAIEAEMAKLKKLLPQTDGPERAAIEKQLQEKELELPEPLPALNVVQDEPGQVIPVHVLARGNSDAPQAKVGARVLGVLLPEDAPELADDTPKPRLALANWIADPNNPLTARVMVNRIWQHHFARGIVATPNDFGRMGSRPSHPELLDWLANQFVSGGFRIKPIHRMILLSNTYQQDYLPVMPDIAKEKDPEDKLLWRFPRRRLDAEELRDAILSVSGRYNPQKGGPSVIVPIEPELVHLIYKPSQWSVNSDPSQFYRRSIYLFEKRNLRLPFLEVFDSPDRLLTCARREASTHAPQALELMNGAFTREMSEAFAQRLRADAGLSAARQVDRAFHLAVGRPPTLVEREKAVWFLKTNPPSEFALAMFLINDFLYVN